MANATQPTPATVAFRDKVMNLAQRDTRFTRLNIQEQQIVLAGLEAYSEPMTGNPRDRAHAVIDLMGEELGISLERTEWLKNRCGTLLHRAFDGVQAGYSGSRKSGKVVPFKRSGKKTATKQAQHKFGNRQGNPRANAS